MGMLQKENKGLTYYEVMHGSRKLEELKRYQTGEKRGEKIYG